MATTVGASAIVLYKNQYIFEIQKSKKWDVDSSGVTRIGIGCIGGTIEINETPLETLQREALEEIGSPINIIKYKQPFSLTSDLDICDILPGKEKIGLFFYWFGTKDPYRECRICVYLGKVNKTPVPDDLGGLLIADIPLLINCLDHDFSFNQCIDRGMELIAKEKIPLQAKMKAVGTVRALDVLYHHYRERIGNLL